MRGSVATTCGRIVESDAFTYFIAAVILLEKLREETGATIEDTALEERIVALRVAMEELENELRVAQGKPRRPSHHFPHGHR